MEFFLKAFILELERCKCVTIVNRKILFTTIIGFLRNSVLGMWRFCLMQISWFFLNLPLLEWYHPYDYRSFTDFSRFEPGCGKWMFRNFLNGVFSLFENNGMFPLSIIFYLVLRVLSLRWLYKIQSCLCLLYLYYFIKN